MVHKRAQHDEVERALQELDRLFLLFLLPSLDVQVVERICARFTWTSSESDLVGGSAGREPADEPPDPAGEGVLLKRVVPEQQAVLVKRDAHVTRADFRLGDSPFDPLAVVADARAPSPGFNLFQRVLHRPPFGVQPRPARPLEHDRRLECLGRDELAHEVPGLRRRRGTRRTARAAAASRQETS